MREAPAIRPVRCQKFSNDIWIELSEAQKRDKIRCASDRLAVKSDAVSPCQKGKISQLGGEKQQARINPVPDKSKSRKKKSSERTAIK